jgi:enamine deaminase RidA (YjgF/YER057c/UK114 family)
MEFHYGRSKSYSRNCEPTLLNVGYVTDIDEFFKHVDVRMEYFGALPTSTTVEVRRLAHPDFLVEIDAIAVVD